MSWDWSYICGCLLCIFKIELQMPKDGCYVPDLGKLGCSVYSPPSPNLEARRNPVNATLQKRLTEAFFLCKWLSN